MATAECKAFCVLQFVKHESVVSVQWASRRQFSSDPPSPNSIRRWYQQFQTTGCLCKGKGAGRPRVGRKRGTSETVFLSQYEEICLISLHLFAKGQTLHEVMFYLIYITNQIFSSYNSRRTTNI
jgi:hypothetical protein